MSILFTLATNLSYTAFSTILFFTTLLNLLRSIATRNNLSISNLSTSEFKLTRFDLRAKLEVSTCEIFFISAFNA